MTQDELKAMVARRALDFIPRSGVIGMGTGSTVDKLIEALGSSDRRPGRVLSSSAHTTQQLRRCGIGVERTEDYACLDVYIDGADEVAPGFELIKGGGACLTGEKILAAMARTFVCIVDRSKMVERLGRFPLPVEVIPGASTMVAAALRREYGAHAVLRAGCLTDNRCQILDVHELDLSDPAGMETALNQIPGVVTVGLFAHRRADVVLYATEDGVVQAEPSWGP